MKINAVEAADYSLPFSKPFYFGTHTLTTKQGYLLILTGGEHTGVGEISIFEEFGTPGFSSIRDMLAAVADFVMQRDTTDILSELGNSSALFPPIVLAAIEHAVFSLLCAEHNTDISALINQQYKKSVLVNAVLSAADADAILLAAQTQYERGYRTFKLKLTANNNQENVKNIELLLKQYGDTIKLRLDANGTWSMQRAEEFFRSTAGFPIEYIEQPVANPKDFPALKSSCTYPIAADESVLNSDVCKEIVSGQLADVLILKPLLLGGLRKTLSIIHEAEQKGIHSVITTSLDSSIGRKVAVAAAAMSDSPYAHGLSTRTLFAAEPFPDIYKPVNGEITIDRLII